ncbi:TetR/AcrR family transcriptional regulator [Patulibacter sp.]|uniref:TetR/AcrR family transcriptional regulator n=1 Tax=Patulibacter sp. TaxID=1912859 RepID=UPI002716422A|nr:TetR/AcrR family transcriptional regulator [Patulibacter sp.]MDO9410332.1 TetR/AcrR family transcriptional regulator [Patulibacter sp.]
MPSPAESRPAKRSEARERLLATASGLFYAEGIGSVGVNRIVSSSGVTLATFYRHFPGKDDLVVAYLRGVHDAVAARASVLGEEHRGADLVRALGEEVASETGRPGFRGCAFINAASEFEDADSPVRRVVAEHRRWYYELVRRAFDDAGHGLPGNAARHFLMLRDGAMTAGYLDGPVIARRTVGRGVDGLLRSMAIEPVVPHEDDEG